MCPPAGEQSVVIGPTPPPTHGLAVFTTRMLTSLRSLDMLAGRLDTADASLRAKLGRRARQRYQEAYTPKRLDRDLENLLGERPR